VNENIPARVVGAPPPGGALPAKAIFVGRGSADPKNPYDPANATNTSAIDGGVQDIAVYTSFVPAN
jgi:hypothetical protein